MKTVKNIWNFYSQRHISGGIPSTTVKPSATLHSYTHDRIIYYDDNISAYDIQTGAFKTINKIQEQEVFNPKTGDTIEYTDKNGNAFSFSYDKLSRMGSSVNVTKKQQHDYNYDIRSNITKEQSDYGILSDLR